MEIGEDDSAEGGAGGTITNGLGFGHTCGVGTFTWTLSCCLTVFVWETSLSLCVMQSTCLSVCEYIWHCAGLLKLQLNTVNQF